MALVLVTGASTGLGLATATALARAGHDVVLHARTRSRLDGHKIRGQIRGIVLGDLSHRQETVSVAEQANAFGRFDAVIHNAGVMDSADTLAVNVLAPYLLTASMPLPGRAIFLSSSMHHSGRPDLRPIHTGTEASYSDSKLFVTTLALALARRYTSTLSHAVDPGWVPTRMGGSSAPDDLTEGHRTQTWLAAAPVDEIHPTTGGYWHHRKSRRPHPASMDSGFQSLLLETLAARTNLALPATGHVV